MGWMELNAIKANEQLRERAAQSQHQATGKTLEEMRQNLAEIQDNIAHLRTVLEMIRKKLNDA